MGTKSPRSNRFYCTVGLTIGNGCSLLYPFLDMAKVQMTSCLNLILKKPCTLDHI